MSEQKQRAETLIDKEVKFKSIFSFLPIKGKVAYVFEWAQDGTPKSYLVRHWLSKPGEKVLAEDITEILS